MTDGYYIVANPGTHSYSIWRLAEGLWYKGLGSKPYPEPKVVAKSAFDWKDRLTRHRLAQMNL